MTPSQLTFFSTVGCGNPVPKSLAVSDLAGGALDYSVDRELAWLSVSPRDGTTPADVNVSVDMSALAPGTYEAEIRIDAPGADGIAAHRPGHADGQHPAHRQRPRRRVGVQRDQPATLRQGLLDLHNNGTLSGPAARPAASATRCPSTAGRLGHDRRRRLARLHDRDDARGVGQADRPGSAWRTVVLKEQDGQLVYGLYANTDAGLPVRSRVHRRRLRPDRPAPLPLDEWTHIATTWDGTTLRLFVDAAEVASMPLPGRAVTSARPAAHRRQRRLGRVVQGPDRRGPRVRPRALGRPRSPPTATRRSTP